MAALETVDLLSPAATWMPVPTAPDLVGDEKVFTVRATNGSGFYRLNGPAATGHSTPGIWSIELPR